MIEIFIIWRLAVHIGNEAAQKGLKKLRYQIMAVLLWLCGELTGGILGSVFFGSDNSLRVYGMALLGALTGAGMAFLVMRLVPQPESLPIQNENEIMAESRSATKFRRSGWLPALASLLAVTCLCVSFGMALIVQVRSLAQQISASHPVIGIEIDHRGRIVQPVHEVSSKASVIYFGFDFAIPQGGDIPVAVDWYMDGYLVYSLEKTLSQGQVVFALDRKEIFGSSEFKKGNYQVVAHIGEIYLTSAEFVVR
jgi:hypothetical protein